MPWVNSWILKFYTVHMSPALNDFYPGLPQLLTRASTEAAMCFSNYDTTSLVPPFLLVQNLVTYMCRDHLFCRMHNISKKLTLMVVVSTVSWLFHRQQLGEGLSCHPVNRNKQAYGEEHKVKICSLIVRPSLISRLFPCAKQKERERWGLGTIARLAFFARPLQSAFPLLVSS